MIIVVNNQKSNNKYNGSVVVTDEVAKQVASTKSFNTKFELFCFGVQQNWSKKSIMKYCLDTTREQYFHNYYTKYLANKNN